VDIMEAVSGLEQHLRAVVGSATEKLEQELPVIAGVAGLAASNPAFAALASAANLGEAPEVLATIAELIVKADQALGEAKAAGAAAAQQPVEVPPAA
jgi:hypothetical protein